MAKKTPQFVPEAARAFAEQQGWKLPKTLKTDKDLIDVMEEYLAKAVEKIAAEEQYTCETCEHTVLEPDTFCWFCGTDLTDDGTGGWPPKDEKKAKDGKKEEPKKDDGKKPLAKKDDAEKKPALPLAEYTGRIRKLNSNAGAMAWQIGQLLLEVRANEAYRENKHANLQDYVEAELEVTWASARAYMRYAEVVSQELAEKLGVYRLEVVSRAPEAAREKMIKAALPKAEGGQGLNREKLEEKLREAQVQAAEPSKKEPNKKPPTKKGRPSEPNKKKNLAWLEGQEFNVKMDNEKGTGELLIPGTDLVINLKVLTASIKVKFEHNEPAEE